MPFDFIPLSIPDVIKIIPKKFGDNRGFFLETFKESDFIAAGINEKWVQDNHSKSRKNVIRGLHFQLDPFAQGKLIRVVKGKLMDVAVDIRKESPYYGKWVSEILSEENSEMLWVPQGFAHGVCVLEDDTELIYKISGSEYKPEAESGIIWNDRTLNINWPVNNPIISNKDKTWNSFGELDFSY